MKICFVGPANSAHIEKWCTWFCKYGHEVHVISFLPGVIPNTNVHVIDMGVSAKSSDIAKIKYLFAGKKIKKLINEIKPDVVNAHYATSYGAALALSGVDNYVLSVWGSDIYEFPNKSFLHRLLLKYSLSKATYLFSTSKAMADEARKYTDRAFIITPFGVDMKLFNPNKRTRADNDGAFIVGTVKSLSDTYGISYILSAVADVKNKTDIPLKLRISGKGPQEQEYRNLALKLGISDITNWLGFVSQERAACEWANMDVAIIPSIQESFGVAAVEAQACGTPVIISDIPGLMETTKPGKSSIVVKRKDSKMIASVIIKLYKEKSFCKMMGFEGRKYVMDNFELDQCFKRIEGMFKEKFEKLK